MTWAAVNCISKSTQTKGMSVNVTSWELKWGWPHWMHSPSLQPAGQMVPEIHWVLCPGETPHYQGPFCHRASLLTSISVPAVGPKPASLWLPPSDPTGGCWNVSIPISGIEPDVWGLSRVSDPSSSNLSPGGKTYQSVRISAMLRWPLSLKEGHVELPAAVVAIHSM